MTAWILPSYNRFIGVAIWLTEPYLTWATQTHSQVHILPTDISMYSGCIVCRGLESSARNLQACPQVGENHLSQGHKFFRVLPTGNDWLMQAYEGSHPSAPSQVNAEGQSNGGLPEGLAKVSVVTAHSSAPSSCTLTPQHGQRFSKRSHSTSKSASPGICLWQHASHNTLYNTVCKQAEPTTTVL